MLHRVKGLLISPFILFMIISCVSNPQKPETTDTQSEEKMEKPANSSEITYKGPEDAEAAIKAMEEREDKMDRDSRFVYYSLLISNNDLEKAAAQLEILLSENPEDREILQAYITMADYQGETSKRDDVLSRLTALDPKNSFAFYMKGTFALREEQYVKAVDLFKKSLANSGESVDPETCLGLANAYMHIEDQEEKSLRYFEMAEQSDSSNPFIYSDRSRVYRFLKDYGKAEDDISRAIELYPSEWNYLDRARIRISNLDDKEGAKKDLLAVMEINSENFFANVYLAGIYDEEGDYDNSLIHYEKVLSIAEDYNYAYPALGKIYFIKERWSDSAEMYKKAVETGLKDMTYPLMGWLAYYKDGREKEGQRLLNSYIGQLDRDSSIYEMYRYYLTPTSPYFVQLAIDRDKDDMFRDRMKFYLAMMDSIKGRSDTARVIWGEIANRKGAPEFKLAALLMEKQ